MKRDDELEYKFVEEVWDSVICYVSKVSKKLPAYSYCVLTK